MTIEQMIQRKRELGYSSEYLAELSGVPVSTVRKIMSGSTRSPRRETIVKLESALKRKQGEYTFDDFQRVPEGYHVELIDGYLYDREKSIPLPQQYVDAIMARETSPLYNAPITSDRNDAIDKMAKETSALYNAPITSDPNGKLDKNGKPDRRKKKGRFGDNTLKDLESMPLGWRGELIDGVIYDLSSPTVMHQRAVMKISTQIENHIEKNKLPCEVFQSPMDVRLFDDRDDVVEPDVFVICSSDMDKGRWIQGAPEFIIEILSPSTQGNDLVRKMNLYMEAGVKEYWVVDLDKLTVTVSDFAQNRIGEIYSFDKAIPVGITEGALKIDLSKLKDYSRE